MNRLITTTVVGLIALSAVGPIVVCVLNAAVPAIALLAVAACLVRLVWHYTGRL